jgi:hypothetical protein
MTFIIKFKTFNVFADKWIIKPDTVSGQVIEEKRDWML